MSQKDKKSTITRRRFIADTSMAAVGGALLLGAPAPALSKPKSGETTTVVLIRDRDVLDDNGVPRYETTARMLDTAVSTITGQKDPAAGWKTLIKPDDIVGIKTNVWEPIGTPKQVEQALKQRVMEVGVSEADIGITDRGARRDPLFKRATALINARPMRTHHWSGVGSLIKNYISFVPDPFNYHNDSCADLAKIWKKPLVKDKTRLNVLVMFTPQFHTSGPHGFSPRHVWKYFGMLVGFDPVAIDSIGVQIIRARRKAYFDDDRPLNPPPKHILLADTRHHLGTADPAKIKLVKIGYDKDILI